METVLRDDVEAIDFRRRTRIACEERNLWYGLTSCGCFVRICA